MAGGMLCVATKAAGVMSSAFIGASPLPTVENGFTSTVHKVPPVFVSSSSSDHISVGKSVSQPPPDEWLLAGRHGGMESSDIFSLKPWMIFGGPPTLEEAKSATGDLKDAVDEVSVFWSVFWSRSPNTSLTADIFEPSPSDPSTLDTVITSETSACLPPNIATQAFKLLKENPETQNVVASIASDPNVYEAVIQNPTLVEYLRSGTTAASFDDVGGENHKGTIQSLGTGTEMESFIMTTKSSIINMIIRASNTILSFMGLMGDAGSRCMQSSEAQYLMGLAVMVMMAVFFKRS